jgi:hypothetical protein
LLKGYTVYRKKTLKQGTGKRIIIPKIIIPKIIIPKINIPKINIQTKYSENVAI